jgi:hypothetical protein
MPAGLNQLFDLQFFSDVIPMYFSTTKPNATGRTTIHQQTIRRKIEHG